MAIRKTQPKIARLNTRKVLGVAIRKHNIGLAMQALGLGKQVSRIKSIYIPQITAAEKQISKYKAGGYKKK